MGHGGRGRHVTGGVGVGSMADPICLSDEDLARLADLIVDRLAERLQPTPEPVLLTAQQVAERFGVSAEWVRDHAAELGVVRLGDGKRPRLRFELSKVTAALTARSAGKPSTLRDAPSGGRSRRRV